MTTKRRITIFPADRATTPLHENSTVGGQATVAPASAGGERQMTAAVITARGKRFSLSQIGSIFGSE